MDGSRIDGLARTLATRQPRRQAVLGAAGSALAGLLGLTGAEDAVAACVKPGKPGCKGPKNGKCCQGARCQGGNKAKEGKCTCKGRLKQCGAECVNTKTDKTNCGGCNKRCKGSNTCKDGFCVSTLGCKAGQNACDDPFITGPDDPRICGGDRETSICVCVTDLNGVARCSDITDAFCSTCTSDANCPAGFVCIRGTGVSCACDEEAGSNGNVCIRADCDGLSGSSGRGDGRAALKTPLFH